jgi:hypothetical protein
MYSLASRTIGGLFILCGIMSVPYAMLLVIFSYDSPYQTSDNIIIRSVIIGIPIGLLYIGTYIFIKFTHQDFLWLPWWMNSY